MTAPTLIYEQAQGESPRVFAIAETTRDIALALDTWAKRWIALGWQVRRIDGGWTARVTVGPGQLFERQVWAEIDPAVCAEQLAIALDRWPWLVEVPAGPRHIGEVARDVVRRLGDDR